MSSGRDEMGKGAVNVVERSAEGGEAMTVMGVGSGFGGISAGGWW